MEQNKVHLVQKSSEKFHCNICDYSSCRKGQYLRHLSTDKHKMKLNETNLVQKSSEKFQCICGICFNSRTTLWRHKKICKSENKYEEEEDKKSLTDKELIIMLVKQNTELMDMLKNNNSSQVNHNINSLNNTNSNNKTFNLQFFLNETCKGAMNIMDFVDSIKLQLSDLEKVGELGYTQGISNIITTNLKALDVTQRPVHCTDKKRETMYIKDENKWEKEDDNKTKLRKVIKRVANKNIRLLPKFRENHPDYNNSSSKVSDKYDHIVIEAMGGSGNNDTEKEDKIIHNISNCVVINKCVEIM
jgi:transcriptional regulator with GAF, ATPase, and Fis domain